MSEDPAVPELEPDEDLLRAAVDAGENLVLVVGPDGDLRSWNDRVLAVTGFEDGDLGRMAAADLVHDHDEAVAAAVDRAFEGEEREFEAQIRDVDGGAVHVALRVFPLRNEAGDIEAVAGIGPEAGDHRTAVTGREAALDRMTDAFFAVDENWRLTYVNEQAEPVLAAAMEADLSAAEMVGRHLWQEIPAAVETEFYEHYHEAMETQEPVTFVEEYAPIDTWFEVRAYPSESGLSVYFQDVTEREQRQRRVRAREHVLRETYEIIADPERDFEAKVTSLLAVGSAHLDTDWGTLSAIEGDEYVFEIVTGPDEVQAGDTVPLAATSCERVALDRETLVVGDMSAAPPALAERAGNQDLGLACYLGAPVFVDGEVYGTFCFYGREPRPGGFSDWEVTLVDLMSQWVSYELDRLRTQEELERQNNQLEEFVSIVSHDLRNPVEIIESSLELARETGDDEHLDRADRAVDRMATLIEDLLALAQAGERISETEDIELADVARNCWRTVSTTEADLVVEAESTVRADPTRLRQILENLYRNAVEHAEGSVEVVVGDTPDGFYVADNGPGVPEGERESVFEPGYSTDSDGSGYGLNIVRTVAEAHGWTVDLEESEDGGARFVFAGVEPGSGAEP